jgi:hypothetical protein
MVNRAAEKVRLVGLMTFDSTVQQGATGLQEHLQGDMWYVPRRGRDFIGYFKAACGLTAQRGLAYFPDAADLRSVQCALHSTVMVAPILHSPFSILHSPF